MSTPAPVPLSCIDYVKLIYPPPISPPILGIAKGMCAAGVPNLVVALIVLEMILGRPKHQQTSESEQEKWDLLAKGAMQKSPPSSLEAQMKSLELFNLFEFGDWEEALLYLEIAFPDIDEALLVSLYARARIGTKLTKEVIDFEIGEHKRLAAHMLALSSPAISALSNSPP